MPPLLQRVSRRQLLLGSASAASLHLLPATAQTLATFPSKPVTLIVPYTAGGSSDVGARLLTPELSKLLGQPVVVDNVAGAGGAIGVQKLIRSAPDGHTLLYGGLSEALLVPMINPSVGYKMEDMMPIALAGTSPVSLIVRPDFPANTVDEFVALARKNPGKFTFGSAGIGTFAHLMTEIIKARTGVFMVHIPYRGGSQIMSDVMGGQIDLAVTTVTNAAPMLSGKRVKVLAVSAKERVPLIKDVPTLGESQSLKGLEMDVWAFVFAPAGTPEPIANKLSASINNVLSSPAMRDLRIKLGAELAQPLNPAQSKVYLAQQRKMYETVASRVKAE